jgi:hypothetical protein
MAAFSYFKARIFNFILIPLIALLEISKARTTRLTATLKYSSYNNTFPKKYLVSGTGM